jgi:hypothetical protein
MRSTRRFKLSKERFAVVAEGLYERKIEFIAAGNVYYTRQKELPCLLEAAEKVGICLDHSTINWNTKPRIVRICSVSNVISINLLRVACRKTSFERPKVFGATGSPTGFRQI